MSPSDRIFATYLSETRLRWVTACWTRKDVKHLASHHPASAESLASLKPLVEGPFSLLGSSLGGCGTNTYLIMGVDPFDPIPRVLYDAAWRQVSRLSHHLNKLLYSQLKQLGLPTFHLHLKERRQDRKQYWFDASSVRLRSENLSTGKVRRYNCEWLGKIEANFSLSTDTRVCVVYLAEEDDHGKSKGPNIERLKSGRYLVYALSKSSLESSLQLQQQHLRELEQQRQELLALEPEYRFLIDPARLSELGLTPKDLQYSEKLI